MVQEFFHQQYESFTGILTAPTPSSRNKDPVKVDKPTIGSKGTIINP